MVIRYYLGVSPRWYQQARYALELLFEGVGVAGQPVASPADADLVYAPVRPSTMPLHAVWMAADPVADWTQQPCTHTPYQGIPVLYGHRLPVGFSTHDLFCDLLYATFAVATGGWLHGGPRNAWGIPLANDQPLLKRPLVAQYARLLGERLQRVAGRRWAPHPRWPDGKRYAVVLSHDVDRPFLRPEAAFYRERIRRDVAKGQWRTATRAAAGWLRTAWTYGPVPAPEADPNFCFAAWQAVEHPLRARSCFYVATVNAAEVRGLPHDVAYRYDHPALVRALHQALEAGWEVGLHASLEAWKDPQRFVEEKHRLESVLGGHAVVGVRHHHWALDPVHPERTWQAQAEAGFCYDSSLGLNDTPGFRNGMVWPFNPFDPTTASPVNLLQVPPTLMDGGIFYHPVTAEAAEAHLRSHFQQVFAEGGAVVLDWHLEQLNPARLQGAGPILLRVLADLAADSDIYWASPFELATWWQERRRRIAAATPAGHPAYRQRPARRHPLHTRIDRNPTDTDFKRKL
jgi:hypothetical protein